MSKKKKKEKIAKPPSRAMKCVAAWLKAQLWIVNLFFVLAGGVLVWLGVSSSPAATLIPETVAVGSIVMGAITLLLSLCGCCGILRGSKPAMCPYACLLIVVMVIDAAALATLFQTEALVCPGGGCSAANATGVAALNVSGALADVRSRDAVLMLGLYREFDSMYSYCRPRNASTMWRPFTERGALGDVALACQDAQLASFGAWVSDECLAPAASWDAARYAEAGACYASLRAGVGEYRAIRANLTTGVSIGDAEARGFLHELGRGLNTSADSSFVFCACAGALPGWLEGHAFAAKLTGFLVGGIALLLCVCSCQLCKVSGKIKKKKKALEDRYLSMAAGGEASHDDVEMGDNYGGNWGDDGGYTGGMPPPLEQEVI